MALMICPILKGQGVDDAILNAQVQYEGTARSMAMGNAIGAVGGDVTAMCINPAGLGLYRSQEFTFSVAPQYQFCLTDYYGNDSFAHKYRTTIPNMGMVITAESSNYKPLRYFQIGIGLTRTNDFNYRQQTKGLNPSSSMVDSYIQTASDIDQLLEPNTNPGNYFKEHYPYDLGPAWETYLIDRFVDSLGNLFFNSPVPQGDVWQTDNVRSKGRSEEWTIALAANYFDKVFIGASMGLDHLKRISTRTYQETPNDPNYNFYDWELQQELGDTAWGINLKTGIIIFPTSWLRVGLAWHSRTFYTIGEAWSTEIQTTLKGVHGEQDYHRYLSPTLDWSYSFYTPNTFIGSMAFFIGQRGMISTDVEYMNYGASKFKYDEEDQYFKEILKPTCNFRLGTEWRLRQYFLRGGLAYYGSPYGLSKNYGSVKKLGLGIGYAVNEETTWDFAYELTQSTTGYTPYQFYVDEQNAVEDAVRRQWRNKLVVTLKVKL